MASAAKLVVQPGPNDTYLLSLTTPHGSQSVQLHGYATLDKIAGTVRDGLEAIENGGPLSLQRTITDGALFMSEIYRTGATTMNVLFRGAGGHKARFTQLLNATIAGAAAGEIPTLDVVCPVDLGLDVMPLLGSTPHFTSSNGTALLTDARSCFTGLEFEIRNDGTLETRLPNNVLFRRNTRDRVALAPFWHEGVRRVNEEVDLLRDLAYCDVANPQPDLALSKMARGGERLAEMLVHGQDLDEGIVHITGHCKAPKDTPIVNHRLVLGAKTKLRRIKSVNVTVGAINVATTTRPQPLNDGPLAFVSACSAADIEFHAPTSIPQALLDGGYRAVIGPQVPINVDAALAAAAVFYKVLGDNDTVGAALVRMRRYLIEEWHNPVGLAYKCYGDSRLRLRERDGAA
jgi:hypothetical protein